MIIRTTFDTRQETLFKFSREILLLAYSWASQPNLRRDTPLEVVAVGDGAPSVLAQLSDWGAKIIRSAPHRLDAISKSANKLLGLELPGEKPVLVVDNDVCFLGDIGDLPVSRIMASVAGAERISREQWEVIGARTGHWPLSRTWVPLGDEFAARMSGTTPAHSTRLYLNSGVIVAPEPGVLASHWALWIEAIAEIFREHPLRNSVVFGSDQAGFALAVSMAGAFDVLPVAYNYRPPSFWLGQLSPDDIKIVHLTRPGASIRLDQSGYDELVGYWDARILAPIRPFNDITLRDRYLADALRVRDRVLALAKNAYSDRLDTPL